jgi:hypothetical protein
MFVARVIATGEFVTGYRTSSPDLQSAIYYAGKGPMRAFITRMNKPCRWNGNQPPIDCEVVEVKMVLVEDLPKPVEVQEVEESYAGPLYNPNVVVELEP